MRLRSAALCIIALASLLTIGCRKETEEDKVRKVVSAMQAATEEKKVLAVQEHISRSYRDPQGNDFEAIKGLFNFYFFRHKTVAVAIPSLEVAVNGPAATAAFTAILSAKGIDGESASILLPDALGAYRFEVSFRQEEGKWKIVSAKWERALEGGGQQ